METFSISIFLILVVGPLCLVGLIALVSIYNSLVKKRNGVDQFYSNVGVLIKKRFDLIPNLVEMAREYKDHEQDTLGALMELRRQYQAAPGISESINIENQASQLMGRLLAVVENYPELKANENYMHVQKTLVEIEEQISAGRRIFNNEVTVYNNEVQVFPNVLVAQPMGFVKMPWFEVDVAQLDPPKL